MEPDYSCEIYLKSNPDLSELDIDDKTLFLHWIKQGKYENRIS